MPTESLGSTPCVQLQSVSSCCVLGWTVYCQPGRINLQGPEHHLATSPSRCLAMAPKAAGQGRWTFRPWALALEPTSWPACSLATDLATGPSAQVGLCLRALTAYPHLLLTHIHANVPLSPPYIPSSNAMAWPRRGPRNLCLFYLT